MMSGLNSYDYGARQYYSVVPGWDRVDPLCEKYYYNISPYAYCMGNPIMCADHEGLYPVITITAQKSGGTIWQRVIGDTKTKGVPLLTRADLYTATVTDTEDKNFSYSFTVTRDAFAIKDGNSDGKHAVLSNCCFEPIDEVNNEFDTGLDCFPFGTDFKSLALMEGTSTSIPCRANETSVVCGYRKNADLAKDVRLPIGGIYYVDGEIHFAASESCFGIAKDDKTPSNDYHNEVMKVILRRAKKSSSHNIVIIVVPRNPNEIPQDVNVTI